LIERGANVVPSSYLEFMITAAGAAGAMIGLLFVAVSLRTDTVFGPTAPPKARTLAGSSFTSLVNAFSLSLLAIVPSTNIGFGMVILAVTCFWATWTLHRRTIKEFPQWRLLLLSCLSYLLQFTGGVALIARPHTTWIVNGLCYVIFASFVIALTRAWDLIQGEASTRLHPELREH
jgi:hypothetical protein